MFSLLNDHHKLLSYDLGRLNSFVKWSPREVYGNGDSPREALLLRRIPEKVHPSNISGHVVLPAYEASWDDVEIGSGAVLSMQCLA